MCFIAHITTYQNYKSQIGGSWQGTAHESIVHINVFLWIDSKKGRFIYVRFNNLKHKNTYTELFFYANKHSDQIIGQTHIINTQKGLLSRDIWNFT